MPVSLRLDRPEYLMEAAELATFMLSASMFAILLFHPAAPLPSAIPHPLARRALMGAAMGLTAIAIIYSPWGKRSGAHMNPAATLAFFRLGRVAPRDTLLYIASQFAGGAAGMLLAREIFRDWIGAPEVNYVVTVPGPPGALVAFSAELVITLVLFLAVLRASASAHLARYTGLLVGALVALYITVEAPLSGMSINPARTFGSALAANDWTALWVYLVAPPLGALLAAQAHLRMWGSRQIPCAKLRHLPEVKCIFCQYAGPPTAPSPSAPACPARPPVPATDPFAHPL